MKRILLLLLLLVSAAHAADTIPDQLQETGNNIFNDLITFIQKKSENQDSDIDFLWLILKNKDSINKLFNPQDYIEVVKCIKSELNDIISDNVFDVPAVDKSYNSYVYFTLAFISFMGNKFYRDDYRARFCTKKGGAWVWDDIYEQWSWQPVNYESNGAKYKAPDNWLSKKISPEAYKFLGSTASIGGVVVFSSLCFYSIFKKYFIQPKSIKKRQNLEQMLNIFNRHFYLKLKI